MREHYEILLKRNSIVTVPIQRTDGSNHKSYEAKRHKAENQCLPTFDVCIILLRIQCASLKLYEIVILDSCMQDKFHNNPSLDYSYSKYCTRLTCINDTEKIGDICYKYEVDLSKNESNHRKNVQE